MSAIASTMSVDELHALLKARQVDLDTLQQSYDDYICSSKELEAELESALEHAEAQVSDYSKKKSILEDKLSTLQEKYNQLSREHIQLQTELSKIKEKLEKIEQLKILLEQKNDDLEEKLRISLATEEDLREKLNRSEEDAIFLQSDIDDLRRDRSETEKRLKEELTELHAEISKMSHAQISVTSDDETCHRLDSNNTTAMETTGAAGAANANANNDIIEELELEVAELTNRLAEAEEQNLELNEELERVQEELMNAHTLRDQKLLLSLKETESKVVVLEKELETVSELLQQKDSELKAFHEEKIQQAEVEASQTLAIQLLTDQLVYKAKELDASKLELTDLSADLKAKQQLITGLEKKIEKMQNQQEEAEKIRNELTMSLEDLKQKEASRRERWILEQERLAAQQRGEVFDISNGSTSTIAAAASSSPSSANTGTAAVMSSPLSRPSGYASMASPYIPHSSVSSSVEDEVNQQDSSNDIDPAVAYPVDATELAAESSATTSIDDTNQKEADTTATTDTATVTNESKNHMDVDSTPNDNTSYIALLSSESLHTPIKGHIDLSDPNPTLPPIHTITTELTIRSPGQNDYPLDELSNYDQEMTLSQWESEKAMLHRRIAELTAELHLRKTPIHSNIHVNAITPKRSPPLKILSTFSEALLEVKDVVMVDAIPDVDGTTGIVTSDVQCTTPDSSGSADNTPTDNTDNSLAKVTELTSAFSVPTSTSTIDPAAPTPTPTPSRVMEVQPSTPSVTKPSSKLLPPPPNGTTTPAVRTSPISLIPIMTSTPSFQLQPTNVPSGFTDVTSSTQIAVQSVISTNDPEKMAVELKKQMDRLDAMRMNNASLLQKLQALKGNIQVCCRSRPPSDHELDHGATLCIEVVDDSELACYDRRLGAWKSFAFDKVWGADATQAEVFADIEPLSLSVVDGYNACILAYGQTGSGKTFTMNGYGQQFGVSYRTLHKIFELLQLKQSQAEKMAARIKTGKSKRSQLEIKGKSIPINSASNNIIEDEESSFHESKINVSDIQNDQNSFINDSQDVDLSEISINNYSNCNNNNNEPVTTLSGSRHSSPPTYHNPDTSETADNNNNNNNNNDDDEEDYSPFSYSVEVSMLEIYNEQIKDLLNPSDNPNNSLDARQTQDGAVYVPGLSQEIVTCLEEVMVVFNRGSSNRATGATNLNEHSSRSHSLLMVTVTTSTAGGPPTKGKLYLVDLAGSERVTKSGVTGAAMKEAQFINKSLSALGDVMEALDSRSKHIPFRNSKLTYLLQDSLGGNSRTMMIVTVCPTELSVEETLFTLQFATRVRRINLGAARRNVTAKNLEEALKTVKIELKDTKKRKAQLEDTLAEMKREQKRTQEKMTAQMDARVRNIDDVRKGVETQIQSLNRTNADLTIKLVEEREARHQSTLDLEALQRTLKRTQELLKLSNKERDDLAFSLKQRLKEQDHLRLHLRELEKEKEKDKDHRLERITGSRRTSLSGGSAAVSATSSHKSHTLPTPGRSTTPLSSKKNKTRVDADNETDNNSVHSLSKDKDKEKEKEKDRPIRSKHTTAASSSSSTLSISNSILKSNATVTSTTSQPTTASAASSHANNRSTSSTSSLSLSRNLNATSTATATATKTVKAASNAEDVNDDNNTVAIGEEWKDLLGNDDDSIAMTLDELTVVSVAGSTTRVAPSAATSHHRSATATSSLSVSTSTLSLASVASSAVTSTSGTVSSGPVSGGGPVGGAAAGSAMSRNRNAEAMLRHQERMKKRREQDRGSRGMSSGQASSLL